MILPIGTDHDGRRPAIAVGLLILANVVAFGAMQAGIGRLWEPPETGIGPIEAFVDLFAFDPRHPRWWQMVTSLFVHSPGSMWHLAGNMLFLWVFGKPVESHVGFWRFLLLYFLGGIVACCGHWLLSSAPVIGASGAVFAVTGLFAALFPRSHTKFLFLIGFAIIAIPSLWVVGIFGLLDVVRQLFDSTGFARSGVAAGAHLAGLAFGLLAGVALLKLGWVPRGEWDLLYLLRQWQRRRAMRAAFQGTERSPWTGGPARGGAVKASSECAAAGPALDPHTARVAGIRARVHAALRERRGEAAITGWRELLAIDADAVFTAELQADLANRALAEGDAALAARGYERFLAAYPRDAKANDVRVLLAAVYIRRLGRPADARPLLAPFLVGAAAEGAVLSDDPQRSLAQTLAAEAGS